MTTTKICTGCKTEKPLEDFYRDCSSRDGRQSQCRECAKAGARAHAQKPEVKARRKAHAQKPEIKAKKNAWQKDYNYKRRYGLDTSAVAMMVLARDGKCEACGKGEDLVVDHIDGTKLVRGLLCSEHNLAAGLCHHSWEEAQGVTDYLCTAEFDVFAGIKQKRILRAA
jgi:hypothetical protein